jgi:TnpA family transposase
MPGMFLSSKERERLACFPDDIPHWDLITYFTLSEQDCTFIKSHRSDTHRLGVALQLCTMRYLGFCPTALHEAPMETVSHLAGQLDVNPSALEDYGKRQMTRSAHFQAVLDYLKFRRMQADDQAQLLTWVTERALEHDKPTLLFQMACEHLKQQQILRPGVTVVSNASWLVLAPRLITSRYAASNPY